MASGSAQGELVWWGLVWPPVWREQGRVWPQLGWRKRVRHWLVQRETVWQRARRELALPAPEPGRQTAQPQEEAGWGREAESRLPPNPPHLHPHKIPAGRSA